MTKNATAELASLPVDAAAWHSLVQDIRRWAQELGFQQLGICTPELDAQRARLDRWLANGYQGDMSFMERHQDLRLDPALLHPGTQRIISVRMDYLPPQVQTLRVLQNRNQGYISRYALGRDYHKLMRKRLTQLAKKIESRVGAFGHRAFVDSAPVLEKNLAQQSGLGWQGKHSLIINRKAGSYFLLGELFVDLPLPVDAAYSQEHCRRCTACLDICPTNAFPEPYVLDASRCISYLTIEHKGAIPVELRPLMGNRIFGCDDCQLVCPWNRYCHFTEETDFHPRHQLDQRRLIDLFEWDEATFLQRTEGSAIRRTGYECWQRNLAIALGNSGDSGESLTRLKARREAASPLVQEHIDWAIARLECHAEAVALPLTEQHPRKVRHLL